MGSDALIVVAVCLALGAIVETYRSGREISKFKRDILAASIKSETAKSLSDHALTRCIDLTIKLGAIEKSTHSIHPVPVGDMDKILEEQMQKLTGVGKEDYESDLANMGFDADPTTSVDELV